MAYVPNVQFDLFVSYAHGDGNARWVDRTTRELAYELRRHGLDVARFWDQERPRHENVYEDLSNAVHHSALFVPIVSTGYLMSEWCRREFRAFLEATRDRPLKRERVFPVRFRTPHLDDIDVSPAEAEVLDSYSYDFTKKPSGEAELELTVDTNAWKLAIARMALRMEPVLRKLSQEADNGYAVAGQGGMVYLAPPTSDLRHEWRDAESYLSAARLRVVTNDAPVLDDPMARRGFEWKLEDALKRCQTFVQIIGDDDGGGIPEIVFRAAERARLKIFLLKMPSRGAGRVSEAHRRLRDRAMYEAVSDVEWKKFLQDVCDHARGVGKSNVRVDPVPPVDPGKMQVFLNALPEDAEQADHVKKFLTERLGDRVQYLQRPRGTARQIKTTIDSAMKTFDAQIVVWGSAKPDWVVNEILAFANKQKSQRRTSPQHVYETLPLPVPKLRDDLCIDLGQWATVHAFPEGCTDDTLAAALEPLVRQ